MQDMLNKVGQRNVWLYYS